MRRQSPHQGFIRLMLLAMLLAPLQSFALVYANMDHKHTMPMVAEEKSCQYDDQLQLHTSGDHCMHDVQCNTQCDHCAHCQYFPSAPFALKQTRFHLINRGTDIAFVSHIPQADLRPPRLA